uniref:Enkurin domain-containing protein n=1 Tax=Timema bartmani TaxID=61472 RepID=A0A7R9I183_9NEOP|nr:unnamed protein product [Timema bartmani]
MNIADELGTPGIPNRRKGKYLRDRQEQWQKALEAKLANIPDPLCPEGHVPLPDQERKATLNLLRNMKFCYDGVLQNVLFEFRYSTEEERMLLLAIVLEDEENLGGGGYAEMVKELNMMPVRSDTLRARQRKIELESQLNKLEDGIKVFSRPRVFIKVGE